MNYNVTMLVVIFLVFLGHHFDVGSCDKILAVLPFPSRSHYAIPDPLLVRLAERGHDVTVYSPYLKKDKIPNYKEIDIGHCFPLAPNTLTMDRLASMASNHFINLYTIFFTPLFDNFGNCEPLLQLLNSTEKYDVYLTETFVSDIMLMYAWKFNVPLIAFTPNAMFPWLSSRMGNPDNPSYVPNILSGYLEKMTFFQRIENTIIYTLSLVLYKYQTSRHDNALIHKYFESAPPVEDIFRNTSLLFVGMNSVINSPIPLVPGVVNIGGIHIKPPTPIPEVSKDPSVSILLESKAE